MNDLYSIEVPTEQGYSQIFRLTINEIIEFKELLLREEGTECIGFYFLRVEGGNLSLYSDRSFNGSCYVMNAQDTLDLIDNIIN